MRSIQEKIMPIAEVAEPQGSTKAHGEKHAHGDLRARDDKPSSAMAAETKAEKSVGTQTSSSGSFSWREKVLSPGNIELLRSSAVGLLSLALGLVLWQTATVNDFNFFINFENVPSPLTVGEAFVRHLGNAEFFVHITVSLKRILLAYGIAVALGIAIGLVVGRSKTARAAVLPYVEIIRPIPAVAWIPLAILMWPTEESSIVYITFLGALFPIILNTVQGVEQTPEVLIRAARSLGATRLQVFWHVVLPSALPSISTGLAVGMGVSWFSLLAGEIISGQYGIGYFTWNAYSLINYPDIVVGMLVIGCLGSLSTYLVRLVMRPALRWNAKQR